MKTKCLYAQSESIAYCPYYQNDDCTEDCNFAERKEQQEKEEPIIQNGLERFITKYPDWKNE